MLEVLFTLLMLILLQAVLGFDNLLYISLESKRVEGEAEQKRVRVLGIGLAVALRIILLFVVLTIYNSLKEPLFLIKTTVISGQFKMSDLLAMFGGGFILYTAVKEIMHMMSLEVVHGEKQEGAKPSKVIALIVFVNLIFSFDSILSAISLTSNVDEKTATVLMVIAILVSGALMILLADNVAKFLQKNRIYEVLGLFVLFVVGILLLGEGAHHAHMYLFGHEVIAMSKATFYFVIAVLVVVDLVQTRYQKRLLALHEAKGDLELELAQDTVSSDLE